MRLEVDGTPAELSLGDLDGDGQRDVLVTGYADDDSVVDWLFSGASLS